jgi:hypothetical protein
MGRKEVPAMSRWIIIGVSLAGGILIGLASGHFMPCYGAEMASAELIVVHIDREGREYSRQERLFRSPRECEIARVQTIVDYWQAVSSGYRSGMKAICIQKL